MFIYELSGCEFESSCSHLKLIDLSATMQLHVKLHENEHIYRESW